MYHITLQEVTGKTHFQESINVNDIDRYMLDRYDASLYSDGVYIPNPPQNQQERLFVEIDMTE